MHRQTHTHTHTHTKVIITLLIESKIELLFILHLYFFFPSFHNNMASRKKRKRVTYVQEIDIKYYLSIEGREAAASIPLFMQIHIYMSFVFWNFGTP